MVVVKKLSNMLAMNITLEQPTIDRLDWMKKNTERHFRRQSRIPTNNDQAISERGRSRSFWSWPFNT
jgi:hypothetical protein